MGDKFRFGILGAGVASTYHAKAIEAHPDGEVVAVAAFSKASAEKFAAQHHCEALTEWRELIHRKDIDAVCVCTPTGLHAEHSLEAMRAGKHVLVEKTMATTLKDATEMIRTAKDHDVKLGVIFQKRTDEAPNKIKKAIHDGTFGKIVLADAVAIYWRNQAYYDSAAWRGTWALEGGGAAMTQGIHAIDLILYMVGDVEKVYAKMNTAAHNIEVEDIALALVTYKNGAYGCIESATATNPGRGNTFTIYGTHGSVVMVEDTITSWAVSDLKETTAAETVFGIEGKAGTATSSPTTFPVRGHIIQVANFINAVRKNDPLICSGEEGRRSLQLITAIYESSRRGEEVYLDELLEGLEV